MFPKSQVRDMVISFIGKLIENNFVSSDNETNVIAIWDNEIVNEKDNKVSTKKKSGWNIFQKEMRPQAINILVENNQPTTMINVNKQLSVMWKSNESYKNQYDEKAKKQNAENLYEEKKKPKIMRKTKVIEKEIPKVVEMTDEEKEIPKVVEMTDEEKETPKPKRGRKSKKTNEEIPKIVEMTGEEKEIPKPKRGRKPKQTNGETPKAVEMTDEEKETPKPKRGRKSKKTNEETLKTVEMTDGEKETPKPKRGRKPKKTNEEPPKAVEMTDEEKETLAPKEIETCNNISNENIEVTNMKKLNEENREIFKVLNEEKTENNVNSGIPKSLKQEILSMGYSAYFNKRKNEIKRESPYLIIKDIVLIIKDEWAMLSRE